MTQQEGENDTIADENTPFRSAAGVAVAKAAVRDKYYRPSVVFPLTLLIALAVAVAIVHRADVFSSSSSSSSSNNNKTNNTMVSFPRVGFDKAVATVAVAVAVTSDDSCATYVQGAGPCCHGRSLSCGQVCDYLLMCDDGYVPVPFYIDDDRATRFPETSDYQPHNCHCRGYEDYNGCFCRQAREMIMHVVDHAGIGSCDPCPVPTPSPTHSPTTLLSEQTCKVAGGEYLAYLDIGRRDVDTSKPFYSCFVITEKSPPPPPPQYMLIPPTGGSLLDSSLRDEVGAAKIGAHCWTESIQIVPGVNVGCYPSGYSEDNNIAWRGTSGRGNGNCGDPCNKFDENIPFDRTCTVSKGVFHNHDLHSYSCYQWKDTTKYCWHYNLPNGLICEPLGYMFAQFGKYSEGWYDAWNASPTSDNPDNCGPPCTEFEPQ